MMMWRHSQGQTRGVGSTKCQSQKPTQASFGDAQKSFPEIPSHYTNKVGCIVFISKQIEGKEREEGASDVNFKPNWSVDIRGADGAGVGLRFKQGW